MTTIPQQSLRAAIAAVLPAAGSTGIMACALVVRGPDSITLTASDYDVTLQTTMPAPHGDVWTLCVNARALNDVVSAMPAGDVAIEALDASMTLSAGRSRFTLRGLGADEFPDVAIGDAEGAHAPLNIDGIKRVSHAVSADESRPALNGICMGADGSMTATDGHRIAHAPGDGSGGVAAILHRRAVDIVSRMDAPTIAAAGRHMLITSGPTTLTVRAIEEVFPDWRRVVPEHKPTLTVGNAALVSALRRVGVLGSGKHALVRVKIADGRMTLDATHPELGDAHAEVECDVTGADVEIGMNPRYMLDALAAVGGETVTLALGDQFAPMLVTGGDGVLCVCMPMRL